MIAMQRHESRDSRTHEGRGSGVRDPARNRDSNRRKGTERGEDKERDTQAPKCRSIESYQT